MITKNEISSLNLSPTKKDFVQIWNELMEVASKITERWDPTSTNESDPGIVLLKVLTGIADKLNYNIDKNILEAFMPTAAQMESMRKLCELVGYDIKYYQSAETKVKIKYTGNTSDRSEDNDEKLPEPGGLAIPKFTTITNADKDITFVTTNEIPVFITNDNPGVEVSCIEGQISQCESINENNLITLTQLDDEYRYYLPEIQIAENGIFVYNAAISSDGNYVDGVHWEQVSNLNTRSAETKVYKFGYDSFEGRPYLAFPEDIGSLIGDGLFIYFIRTSGLNGNISPRTLEALEIPTGNGWEDYSAEQFEVVNEDATTNGANIESISAAYNNFKKTVGTFDTLVTCRDYMNKIYSLMDASNSPYVSNILVTDIRNDINSAVTLCSCNEFGILYKEMPLTRTVSGMSLNRRLDTSRGVNQLIIETGDDVLTEIEEPLIDHFDLVLYPFKTFNQVSSGTKDLVKPYNSSFEYSELMNREIEASIDEFKTCAHNFVTPAEGSLVSINNYLRLNALIATSNKVSEIEAKSILQNVKVALINEFNMRNLDFGEEIPFDNILSVIENADSRIKVVSLQEPTVLTTYSVKVQSDNGATSKEYGILSTASDIKINGVNYTYTDKIKDEDTGEETEVERIDETAKEIYNKLVLRNILAGRAALLDYEETFVSNNSEKPYTITKDITAEIDPNSEIAAAVSALIGNADTNVGEYLLYNGDDLITVGLNSSDSVLALKVFDEDITKKLEAILADTKQQVYSTDIYTAAEQIVNAMASMGEKGPGEYFLEDDEVPVTGFSNGILYLVVSEDPEDSEAKVYKVLEKRAYKVYETYEPSFSVGEVEPAVATFSRTTRNNTQSNSSIINDISRVEAVCEVSGDSGVFENIKLEKNEVIKFRAPNLITTKTFPAYVYYRFEKAISSAASSDVQKAKEGKYASCKSLSSFITSIGTETFFNTLWDIAKNVNDALVTFTALKPKGPALDQRNKIAEVFNTSIAIRRTTTAVGIKEIYTDSGELATDLEEYFKTEGSKDIIFEYCPLNTSTMDNVWGEAIKACKPELSQYPQVLWKLSSTSNYPMGKLVISGGRKLFTPTGDFFMNCVVGSDIFVCTDQGEDPEYYTLSENSDIELQTGDKLYIHYTPSSTNEDGETVNAEPVSIIYTGSATDPIILKPSGFALTPTDDVVRNQGISYKKHVTFPGETQEKGLLALAPNEQIELRSVSKVVLDTPARFYKNFDNADLEQGNINDPVSYELKDGEYIFYTDKNNQDAAYYGSGSVITLAPGAYIPKASEQIEVSQILEQGLHIVPWSSFVLLDSDKTITVAEYQYVTLVEGDTLNILKAGNGTPLSKSWLACDQTEQSGRPITYTPSGAESATTLPKIQLGQGSNIGWEVCSLLELSTSPGHAQQLRATDAITNKINVFTKSGTGEKLAYKIEPQKSDLIGEYEKVSVKLSTIAQSASGSLKDTSTSEDPVNIQMKVFKEEVPSKVEFMEADDIITPISAKPSASAATSSDNINNYLTKVEIGELWRSVTEVELKQDEDGNEVQVSVQKDLPNALKLNFMIPKVADIFGIFSIYLEAPVDKLDSKSKQNMLKGPEGDTKGSRVFIDVPPEFGSYKDVISIYNNNDDWWSEGIDLRTEDRPYDRLYLRAGLNCIKVTKPCSLYIKAEENVTGSILYDNMRLVKGVATNGINLKLLDPNTEFNTEAARIAVIAAKDATKLTQQDKDELAAFNTYKEALANNILDIIAKLDKNHDFYYNVLIENSLAIEFDDNINAFSSPYTLYDINNVNNSFVISKLDVNYLEDGLRIAKSSRY